MVLATWRSGQGLYSDPALQIKTVQEFLAGASPHLNGWARPNYSDISSDQIEQLIVWAPGTSFAIAPFMRAGLSPAAAARTVAALALVCGSAGWVYWFGLFDLPYGILMALAIAFPWMRSASNALFLYTSEILVFALVPWTLCLALIADRRRRLGWCLAAGLLAGSLYVVKYSAGFVSAGIVAWLAYRAWRERGAAIAAWLVTTAAVALPVLALTVFNHQFGSANLLTASLGGAFDWRNAVHAVAMPALAAADLDAVLLFVLMHPAHPMLQNLLWISLIGLPGGLLLVVLAARRGVDGPHAALARAVFFVSHCRHPLDLDDLERGQHRVSPLVVGSLLCAPARAGEGLPLVAPIRDRRQKRPGRRRRRISRRAAAVRAGLGCGEGRAVSIRLPSRVERHLQPAVRGTRRGARGGERGARFSIRPATSGISPSR